MLVFIVHGLVLNGTSLYGIDTKIVCNAQTCSLLGVVMKYDVLLQIMREDVIEPNDFIELRFENGDRGAVRKRSINGFCESREEV